MRMTTPDFYENVERLSTPALIISSEQVQKIEELFSKNDPRHMTTGELDDLFLALEDAGIGGPEIRAAVIASGLDFAKFLYLIQMPAA